MKFSIFSILSVLPRAISGQIPLIQDAAPMDDLLTAMDTLQTEFFESWLGTWPEAIDWTRAVLGTHLAAGSLTYSKSLPNLTLQDENIINKYFSQIQAYYFGQDHISIRYQAYDDILWVVLGWLDAINLIASHSAAHLPSWYGSIFTPAFAHRARIFWELATAGWDESLCGGGMIWSPWLVPYKNAITNELFISASINMYLYFSGDDNDFPFDTQQGNTIRLPSKHNKIFLEAATKAYSWLESSGMTNSQGLYIDGFHSQTWANHTGVCDVRNEMVYTYNQGVILSAHRGLFLVTGNRIYLTAGHELISSVIKATGYNLPSRSWSGLGRNGILEDYCDASGDCSQDGQTFKGIFFHHLTEFCQPLPVGPQESPFHGADRDTGTLHLNSCRSYAGWVERNAKAAWATSDSRGIVGMWWTPGLGEGVDEAVVEGQGKDYRNKGIPGDWTKEGKDAENCCRPITEDREMDDPNDRGRGRTVESHSGGVAVLRAHVEFQALLDFSYSS